MADVDLGTLTLQISANSTSASASINTLRKSLEGLNVTVGGMTGLTAVTTQLRDFARSMSTLSAATGTLSGFKSAANAVKNAVKAFEQLQAVDAKGSARNINGIVKSLESLQSVEKAGGFTSTVNSLKKLPDVAKQLDGMDMTGFASRIQEITVALQPLATEIDQISNGFGRLPNRLNQLNTAANRASAGTNRFGIVLNRVFSFMLWRRIGNLLGGLIKKSTEYVEDLNLFTVAMGQYADEAQNYAEKVSEVMGIDVAQWMRAQGVFQTLATGFGVSADRAAVMSKNLTQLAYDISSFYNLDIDKAMQKLESGFAGEIEPVRRLGYDLSKTTLQATAASLGITKLFADMTQAEKSQLRYYALMTQVTQVQGDMARTLSAPANQLRILTAQLEMTKRALGNIFIPALNAVLPYLIAFAKFVRLVADEIARFFGYTLPEIDYSNISVGIGDVEGSVDDLTDSLGRSGKRAKELKGLLASFDELNIIQSETGGGGYGSSGGLNGAGSNGWKDFALPEYDFLKDMLSSRADEIFAKMKRSLEKWKPVLRWIRDHFSQIFDIVKAVGLGLLGWKVSSGVANLFGKTLSGRTGLGIGLTIGGFSLEFSGARNIGAGKAELWDYIKTALGAALGIAGSLLIFGTGPVGWVIGIGAAITVFVAGFAIGHKAELRAKIEQAFFDGVGKPIEEIAAEYNERMNNVKLQFTPLLDAAEGIHSVDTQAQAAATNLSGFMQSLEEGSVVTSETVETIQGYFDTLYEGMSEKLSLVDILIRDSLVTAMQDAAGSVGLEVNNILGELARITGNEEAHLRDLRAQANNIISSLSGMVVGSEEYNTAIDRLGEITGEMAALSQTINPAIGEWERLKTEMSEGVNFKSVEDARAAIEEMASTSQAAKDAIDQAFREADNYILGKIKYAEQYAPEEVQFWQEYRNVNREAFDAQKANIDRDFLEMSDYLQTSLGNHVVNALGDIDTGNDWDFYAVASSLARDFVEPIAYELEDAFAQLGIDGDAWVDDAVEQMLSNITDYLNFGGSLVDFSGLNDTVSNGFSDIGDAAVQDFKAAVEGGKPGIMAYLYDFVDVSGLTSSATNAGKEIGSGLTDGISNGVSAGTAAIGRRLARWWESIRPVNGVAGDPFSWGTVVVQPYATGGFPRAGSLFLAGEGGGAELVGSMGNQTAVANGDQIVAGIAYGVSMANAEETRLMREQNGLLRQIIAAVLRSGFTPSPESGAMIQSALDMYATQRGY